MSDEIKNEFSHIVRMDQINGQTLSISANTDERQALTGRFHLQNLDQLFAEVALIRDGSIVQLSGIMKAKATQNCIISGEPVETEIEEKLRINFIPQPDHAPDAEIELDDGDCDSIFHDGAQIDIGEAVAQSLSLSLDPYPRADSADSTGKAMGIKSEEEAGPFGALADLKAKLEKDV